MRVGIVTDDFTGGNDIAGRFGGAGFRSYSCLGPRVSRATSREAEVLVLNARSRFMAAKQAGMASARAWQGMLKGPEAPAILYQKIDSTLRGNPAAEMEALIGTSKAGWMAVVPAYPRAGRQTLGGRLLVNGQRLDRTEYAHDPLNPARQFRVDRLFKRAWSAHVPLKQVCAGGRALAAHLEAVRLKKPQARFITFDAMETRHLDLIAWACLKAGCRAFGGASGLAGALAHGLGGRPSELLKPTAFAKVGLRKVVGMAGTLSQTTLDQLALAEARGAGSWINLEQDDYLPFPARVRPSLLAMCREGFKRDGALWLSTVRAREEAWQARKRGRRLGMDGSRVAEAAIQALARLGGLILDQGTLVILTGGHTAEVFFERQNLQGAWILGELEQGLPLGRAEGPGNRRLWIASKPGGFGKPDVLLKAAARIGNF